MHYNFYIKWLKAFRESPEAVCSLYGPGDDFVFEDVMLDQHNVDNQPDLHRLFAPYANKDRGNGIGVHNFRARSYVGDERFGLLRWEWSPENAAVFLGLDVKDKPFTVQGHTFHIFDKAGFIKRESSWWDAHKVIRASGIANPSKYVTGALYKGASTKSGDVKNSSARAGTMAFAERWTDAVGRDTDALRSLYADYFTADWYTADDHVDDTITNTQMLKEHLGGIASGTNGKYTFSPTAYFGDEKHGLIHWDVTIEGADTYRGMPVNGKTLKSIGSTFHQYDNEGKIILESTFIEDNRVFVQLGLPIVRPHYWRADFDPASLA